MTTRCSCWCCGHSLPDAFVRITPPGEPERLICPQCSNHAEFTDGALRLPMRCPLTNKPHLHEAGE